MAKGGYSFSSRRTKNSQLIRQKSVEIHMSLTLMRVKLESITLKKVSLRVGMGGKQGKEKKNGILPKRKFFSAEKKTKYLFFG